LNTSGGQWRSRLKRWRAAQLFKGEVLGARQQERASIAAQSP
jgi:hypothetical protein